MDVHEIISTSLEVFKQPVVIAAAIGVFLYVKFMIFVASYSQKQEFSSKPKRRISVPKKKPPKEDASSESSEGGESGEGENE